MTLHIFSNTLRKPAKCLVRIGAAQRLITQPHAFIKTLTVDSRRDQSTIATLQLTARRNQGRDATAREAGLFGLNQPILIAADFGTHTEEVMRGFVRDIKARYRSTDSRPSQVTIVCQDESLRLDRRHIRRIWRGEKPTSDRHVAAAILKQHGLVLDPDSGDGSQHPVLHQNDTDLGFLQARAEANGYDLLFKEGQVYFGPMRLDAEPQAVIRVHGGGTAPCRYFAFQRQPLRRTSPVLHQAHGELHGAYYRRVLRVGEPVDIAGVGAAYDGTYYVDTVRHRFTARTYRQFFTLLRHSADSEVRDDITIRAEANKSHALMRSHN
ncbi:MAG TPA: hypothetical protein VES89_12845 [Candidatus Competibacteraceae bacterium]|nr:hypothetical protein [Candidatus Competibacteraceae bacterium]